MDTTPKYILMCEKAGEVLKGWKPRNGDFVWHPNEGVKHMGCWEFPEKFDIVSLSEDTPEDFWYHWLWLPRQDQLQEMVGKSLSWLVWDFEEFTENMTDNSFFEGNSMEQLWLAFVMKEKYNKVWNGKDWINK